LQADQYFGAKKKKKKGTMYTNRERIYSNGYCEKTNIVKTLSVWNLICTKGEFIIGNTKNPQPGEAIDGDTVSSLCHK
jgi:hypothetical protein